MQPCATGESGARKFARDRRNGNSWRDIRWQHRYRDITSVSPQGRFLLDYTKFHDVVARSRDRHSGAERSEEPGIHNHRQRLWIPLADVWERAAIGPIQVTWLLRGWHSMADGYCSRSFPIASRSPRDVSGGA